MEIVERKEKGGQQIFVVGLFEDRVMKVYKVSEEAAVELMAQPKAVLLDIAIKEVSK